MKTLKLIMLCTLLLSGTLTTLAVTEKEMEEAKTIAAQAYLRYANDGSGYLDDLSPKSMSELTGKLKEKEKENLKAFNSVKIPGDYSSWDKDKLVEFWSVTFFTSPALSDKGKVAKTRVRNRVSAMKIAAVTEDKPASTPAPTAAESDIAGESAQQSAQGEAETSSGQEAPETTAAQPDILADQEAISKDAEGAQPLQQEESHTWVYVLVLVILVGIVVWLVAYAAKLMKRQPTYENEATGANLSGSESELREQARKAIAKKTEEIKALHERLQAEEHRNADLSSELERLKLERGRHMREIESLRAENLRLSKEVTTQAGSALRAEAETSARPASSRGGAEVLRTIYLGRANRKGLFVRADRRISAGNTIYRLDTDDGLVGTFHVVDEPEVVDLALSNPEEYLQYGCSVEELDDTAGVRRIITESAGTAIFEDNCWKVLRKTRIRYE